MSVVRRNVIVVGGSFVGCASAKELANILPDTHRVLLVEPHSHFHHLFAFPRFAVVPSHEHKAFIPYTSVFASAPNPSLHAVVKARVVNLTNTHVVLDRAFEGDVRVPFEFLTIATGTKLPAPGGMQDDEKSLSVQYLKTYQQMVKAAQSITIVGGGAVGVQMATDIKEVYPDKEVILVHSQAKLMPRFHHKLHEIVVDRCRELGVKLVTGSRVVIPAGGFPEYKAGTTFQVELQDGRSIPTELVIPATGQVANTSFLTSLRGSFESNDTILNPKNGFIRVRPTLQLEDPKYPNIFAVGDVADTGATKAARPGIAQAAIMARNIAAMIRGETPSEEITISPPGIHLSLGITRNVVFGDPDPAENRTEPLVKLKDDGQEDMGIEGTWKRRGVSLQSPADYHL